MEFIVFESIIVGIYILILYMILQLLLTIPFILYFMVGFLKHFLGYIFGIHAFYCRYKAGKVSSSKWLIIDSLIEGVVVMVSMMILSPFIDSHFAIFITGFLLHLFSEFSGVHTYFLKTRCKMT
jgi:hypothetical protein